ncbi:putative G-protein coupled receptor 179 [Carettochelys insculpta]|uniref:putative G-protein coupled receptor 179 n=1 Tax=Carettochelys insculpta TaxID=44489 RepID=UPI003EB81680
MGGGWWWWWWPLLWGLQVERVWGTGMLPPQKSAPPEGKDWAPSSSPASPWVPTPGLDKVDLEGSEAALTFLYSGDLARLSQANCSRRFEAWEVSGASSPPPGLRAALRGATETLTHATNFLNMIFQTNDIRESSVKEDVEWYHALVRSVAEGDPQVYRAVLTFDAHPASSKPQLILQATKEKNEILLQDLSASSEGPRNLSEESRWLTDLQAQRGLFLHKRVLSNDLKSLETPKWHRGDSYVMDASHVQWSPPFLECQESKFLPSWMVTLSSAFYGLKPDLSPEFKGVVRADIRLQNVALNQCASGPGWFTGTHQCDLNSTQCVPLESRGFILGRYLCLCKPGFYGAHKASGAGESGTEESSSQYAGQYGAMASGTLLECQPCQEGCTTCVDNTPCLIQEDWSLRAAVLSFQACCMLAVCLSMLVSYHFRKSKRIRASGVILLETILFGSLLLYFPVFILYFKPSIFRCIVLRWVRLLGFAIVYGTITLKLYRVLKVFLSRSAQRMPYMTSGRVLRMLALILLLVLWFLAAWTAGTLENIEKNIPLVIRSQTAKGLQFDICDHDRWDYMMVVAEMLFLFWGSFLCYATRTVPSAFHEPRYMGIALHNEMIISAAFHVLRFVMVPSLHPDWTLLLFFVHTHSTITTTLALLFIPKFLHAGASLREEIAAEVYEDELDMRRSGSCLNNSLASAWSEHSLDPDDIRDELKKLYTQLEVHKTKKMAANNPHLQKKRSSKRGLGRSIMRRITELPESVSRPGSKENKERAGGGGSRSHSGSYKRRLLDSGSSSVRVKEESSKHRAFSLRKSHSTYDHVQNPKESAAPPRHDSVCKEPPLLDSLMRKKLAKKASERSNSDSLDSAPLVYKSVSAHNLLADKKPLHPKPSPLQKSLSVLMSAREKALLLTIQAYVEDVCEQTGEREKTAKQGASSPDTQPSGLEEGGEAAKQLQSNDMSQGTKSSLLQDSFDRATVCPWEGEAIPPESKMLKQVTYAPIKSISVDSSHLAGRAPPGGKRTPPQPPLRYQSLAHNLERSKVAPWETQEQTWPTATDTPGQGAKDIVALINICPWEAEELLGKTEKEETGEGAAEARNSKLLSVPSFAAEICPWEPAAEEEGFKQRQQEKPSKAGDAEKPNSPLAKTPDLKALPQKSSIRTLGLAVKAFQQLREKSSSKGKREDEESQRKKDKYTGSRCDKPNLTETPALSISETAKQETPTKGPEESKQKILSKQATICPWEEETTIPPQQNNHTSKAFEICPWERSVEEADSPQGRPMPADASGRAGRRRLKDTGDTVRRKLERTRGQWETICPWETVDSAGALQQLSVEEDKTSHCTEMESENPSLCPGEPAAVITSVKNELRPGDVTKAPPVRQPEDRAPEGDQSIMLQAATSAGKTLEKDSSQREALCPWESTDTQEPSATADTKHTQMPKGTSRKSDSVESKKAEICPWETEEAEVCPWEAAEIPSETRTVRQREKLGLSHGAKSPTQKAATGPSETVDTVNSQQESVCPWESTGTEESPVKMDCKSCELSTGLPKNTGSMESKKAEVCPWETEAVETSCKILRSKARGPPKTLEKDSSQKDSTCPWESTDGKEPSIKPATKSFDESKVAAKTSDSADKKKAEVCPWENVEVEASVKTEVCPWEVVEMPSAKETLDKVGLSNGDQSITWKAATSLSKKLEKGSSQREAICPWESMSLEESSVKPERKSSQLSKGPSKKSNSIESKKAEICPWESEEAEAIAKAEICPWEVSEAPSNKGKLRQSTSEGDETGPSAGDMSTKKLEKGSSQREAICPWESMSLEESSVKPEGKSSQLSKGPSKKSNSIESKKAEICPWESEEAEAIAKAEICPWEVSEAPSNKGKLRQSTSEGDETGPSAGDMSTKKLEKGSSQREAICPWESMSLEESSVKPEGKSSQLSKGPSKKSNSIESKKAEICPWESEEAEAIAKAEICPWEVSEAPSNKGKLRQSTSEGDETGPSAGDMSTKKLEKGSSQREAICPWESMSLEESSVKPEGKSSQLSKGPSKKSNSMESKKAEICPWESEEAEAIAKAEICPWEVPEAPSNKGKLRQSTSEGDETGPRGAGDMSSKKMEKGSSQ